MVSVDVREFFEQSNFLQFLSALFFMYLSIFSFLSSTDRRPTLKLESSIADISVAARGVGLQPLPAIGTLTRQMRLLIEGQDIRCLITVMI
ncbi:hypothetical protein C4D60_Mb05t22420 [Musa balbisiana]|uniref:Uncharacterized protein n=1 Tax=Musa balbisiana TaxID=52838 RepID=A0A4S8JY33_MUSBA|nr:hypothetical protein C4D60_Mb05t22420 [Musa balbisiana]